MTKKILTIGAYERDNFGDFLFFLIIKNALKNKDCIITPGSIIASDMRDYIGEYVFPYDFLLKNYKWDVIWVVGGEIGGVDIEMALNMSFQEKYYKIYKNSNLIAKNIIHKYIVGNINTQLAYLPDISNYNLNSKTLIIVNSVGGFESINNPDKKINMCKIIDSLNNLDELIVRNDITHIYLNSLNIKNGLAPDVAHVLPLFYKGNFLKKEEYILFQINEDYFNKYSLEKIAHVLKKIIDKYDCKVYLFVAGSARYHDNEDFYRKIMKNLADKFNENRIGIVKEKNPLKLVDWIINSKLWIGTSLHGRIISIAYSVRRISLENDKVSNYCKTWDVNFPYNIKLDDLIDSCDIALKVDNNYIINNSEELSSISKKNLDNLISKIYG